MPLRTPSVVAAAALVAPSVGCSLLAPDDAYYVGGPTHVTETKCEPAPPCSAAEAPATITVTPDQAMELHAVVTDAPEGAVIELTPGTYPLSEPLSFARPHVTLRSSTGNAADVTIDGQGYVAMVEITASDVTLSGFTLVNVGAGGAMGGLGIAIVPLPEQRLLHTRLCNLVVRDAGRDHFLQALRTDGWADCGRVEGVLFELTDASATIVCQETPPSGILVSGGWGWVVARSAFSGFTCTPADPANPLGTCPNPPFAIRFDQGSRDTLVENNCMRAVGRGIGFGSEELQARTYQDRPYGYDQLSHVDGIIRNNVLLGGDCYDTGIELNYARRPVVVHNTLVADYVNYAAIDGRFASTNAFVWNNLLDPSGVRTRASGEVDQGGNVLVDPAQLASFFVDPAQLDFHLRPEALAAIDQGAPLDVDAGVDLDGVAHDPAAPDVGADELGAAASPPLDACRLVPTP